MSRQPELYHWIDTVVTHFPTISKPQAMGLALWSFGMVLARWRVRKEYGVRFLF